MKSTHCDSRPPSAACICAIWEDIFRTENPSTPSSDRPGAFQKVLQGKSQRSWWVITGGWRQMFDRKDGRICASEIMHRASKWFAQHVLQAVTVGTRLVQDKLCRELAEKGFSLFLVPVHAHIYTCSPVFKSVLMGKVPFGLLVTLGSNGAIFLLGPDLAIDELVESILSSRPNPNGDRNYVWS